METYETIPILEIHRVGKYRHWLLAHLRCSAFALSASLYGLPMAAGLGLSGIFIAALGQMLLLIMQIEINTRKL